jgi:hypothetical protein
VDSAPISPGLYILKRSSDQQEYYQLNLKTDETLTITLRTPNVDYSYAGASIYDGDGILLRSDAITGERSRKKTIQWGAAHDGVYYITVGNQYSSESPDTLYLVCIE